MRRKRAFICINVIILTMKKLNQNKLQKSRIERVKDRLYYRKFKNKVTSIRPKFYSEKETANTEWASADEDKSLSDLEEKNMAKKSNVFRNLFLVSLVFFVVSAGVAAFLFVGGGNVVSSKNVNIDILGPVSVAGGDELSLQVVIENGNSIDLQLVDLIVEFPEGAQDPNNISKELTRTRIPLGTISSGETINELVRFVLFGEKGIDKSVEISLEYRVDGSNAIFAKNKEYTVLVNSSPLSLVVDTLKEVSSNQEMSIEVIVESNSDSTIEDVLLNIDYPSGFEPIGASPASTYGTSLWELGDIDAGDSASVVVKGVMRAEDSDERVFAVYVGKQNKNNEREIETVYSSSFEKVVVKKPFIGIDVRVNGSSAKEIAIDSEAKTSVVLFWRNNLSTAVNNATIKAKLSGDALNKFSISSGGFYDSNTNTITWNKANTKEFSSIGPGESGSLEFDFSTKSLAGEDMVDLRNLKIDILVSTRGQRLSDEGAVEEIDSLVERSILVNSKLQLIARSVYFDGPLSNLGPLPPKVGNKTSYTVVWSVVNSSNDISGARVTTILPIYMSWNGVISPSSENVRFNENTREVSWDIGYLKAGVGVSRTPREMAFQVSFIPSTSQVGSAPSLTGETSLVGIDEFTGKTLRRTVEAVSTRLRTDLSSGEAQSRVVR